MAIYKYTSLYTVLDKIRRDGGIPISSNKDDMVEWISDCLTSIGSHSYTEKVKLPIKLIANRAVLPCQLISIQAVEYKNQMVNKSISLRHNEPRRINDIQVNKDDYVFSVTLPNFESEEVGDIISEEIYYTDNVHEYWWDYNGTFFMSNLESGTMYIYCTVYKLDEFGLPLIPDTFQHRECIFFFVMYKWLCKGNSHPVLTWKDCYVQYKDLVFKAQNKAKQESIPEALAFKNMWCRLITDSFENENFFDRAGNKEYIKNI